MISPDLILKAVQTAADPAMQAVGAGQLQGGWDFVWGAYGFFWAAIALYGVSLVLGERKPAAQELEQ